MFKIIVYNDSGNSKPGEFMSRYTRFGDFVEQMPQSFTPVMAYGTMGATTDPATKSQSEIAETTQMLKDVQPLIRQLGFLGATFGPMITGFIEAFGTGANDLVQGLPLPADFKKNFAAMSKKAKSAPAQKTTVTSKVQAPSSTSGGIPNGLLIGGGVALFGAATFLALKKKKR